MILVQAIGISGYVPLEGVVGLCHILEHYCSDKCEYEYGFEYLGRGEIDKTYNLGILRVISFAVVRFLDDRVRSIIIRDIGLISGYYNASVVFPDKLRRLFMDIMGLSEYHNLVWPSFHPSYSWVEFVCTSAWAEYVCLDPDVSYASRLPIFIRKLVCKCSLPSYALYELRRVLD